MKSLKLAGSLILYNPTDDDLNNIYSYIDDLDLLYIVDNSPKRNDDRLPNFKKIKYIFNNENEGVAKPHNRVAAEVRKLGYNWLLTMDQDTYINKGVISKMKHIIETEDMSYIGIITPWHKTKLDVVKPKDEITYPIDTMTSGNLVNLEIHKKIGGFKEWLFIDGVDIEYCLNLGVNGYKIMQLNNLEIDHNLGDIFYKKFLGKNILITNHSAMRRYYQTRNYLYIKEMYGNYPMYKSFCDVLVKKKQLIFGIIFYEKSTLKEKVKELKAIKKGVDDYKLRKVGYSYE